MFDAARERGIDSSAGMLDAFLRVHELGIRYAHGEDATRLLDEALGVVILLLHADGGWAHVVDARTTPRHVVVFRQCTEELAALWQSPLTEHAARDAALGGSDPIFIEDVRTAAACSEPLRRALIDAQAVSFRRMPLLARDREMVGAISIFSRTPCPPTEDEQRWAHVVARHTADFIECRRTYQALQYSAVRDREARIRAESATTRTDQFLAMLSHELRQPLSAALPAMEVQKHSDNVERRAHAMKVLEQQLRQMARLVDDLRDVTHIGNGTLELRRERIDLRIVVRKAIETATARFESKRQSMTVDLCHQPAWVMADDARMTQVFSNLLQNAAAYTPPDGQIAVSLEMRDGGVFFRVRDNGIGIASDALKRIFDAYERGAQTNDAVGLGIGLSVVRRLVELHGGTVTATSDGQGLGSEFVVQLPAAR